MKVTRKTRYITSILADKGKIFKYAELRNSSILNEEELNSLTLHFGGRVLQFESDTEYGLSVEDWQDILKDYQTDL